MSALATALITGAMGIGQGVINNLLSRETTQLDRYQNYELNEAAAANADKRTRALYEDYYSPTALLKQYQEAGLSPSMMFGGTPGQGGMTGAQGNGGTGPQTQIMPFNMVEAASAAVQLAQAEKLKEETKVLQGNNPRGAAELAQLYANIGNTKAATGLIRTQTKAMELENYITDKTKEFSIQVAEHQANIFRNEADRTFWDALNGKLDFDFNQETYNDRKQQVTEQVNLLTKEVLLRDSQIKLTDSQQNAVEQEIVRQWSKLVLEAEQIGINKQTAEAQKKYWEESIKNAQEQIENQVQQFGENLHQDKWRIACHTVSNILGGAVTGLIMHGVKNAGKVAGKTVNMPVFMTEPMKQAMYGNQQYNSNSFY